LEKSKKVSNIFTLLGIDAADDDIDLYMTPIDTFGRFNVSKICIGCEVAKNGTITST